MFPACAGALVAGASQAIALPPRVRQTVFLTAAFRNIDSLTFTPKGAKAGFSAANTMSAIDNVGLTRVLPLRRRRPQSL